MKVLVQRVSSAGVDVGGEEVAAIGAGLLVFVGIEVEDDEETADWYARRVATMKFFSAEDGSLWRRTVVERSGEVLAVSQFTLAARTRKGRRPSFDGAAPPGRAEALFGRFVAALRTSGVEVSEGRFGAMMEVRLVNDGPVTFDLEGPKDPSRVDPQ